MADLSDVLTALVGAVDAIIYPNGDANPSAVIVNGSPVPARIYPGWPTPQQLDSDLSAGKINVSVFAPSGMEQNTARFPMEWQDSVAPVRTLTALVDPTGTQVTIGGTVTSPQNVAALVNGQAFVYAVQPNDTLALVAAGLAALVNAFTPASAVGSVITIAAAKRLIARVGSHGTSVQEVGRQNRLFQITFWCPPSPIGVSAIRDAAVRLVDPVLRAMSRLALSDNTFGHLVYQRTFLDDGVQKAGCWRRDLFYTVEYGTTQQQISTEIVVAETQISGGLDPNAPVIETLYQ